MILNSISWSTGISVFGDDCEFDILEHWSILKLPDEEEEILTQERECEDTVPLLAAEYSYSLKNVSSKDSGVPTQQFAKSLDDKEDSSPGLIPSTTNEVTQRRPALGELNSTRTTEESVNNILFNGIPRQKELRPLKYANENYLPSVTEKKTNHSPFKGKRTWCCEEHRIEARNTRERGKRGMRKAQSVLEHDPFQHRKNRQWCCFNHQTQFWNERRRRQRRRGKK